MKQRQEIFDSFVALRVVAGLIAGAGLAAWIRKYWALATHGGGLGLGDAVFALAVAFSICVLGYFAVTGRFVFLRGRSARVK